MDQNQQGAGGKAPRVPLGSRNDQQRSTFSPGFFALLRSPLGAVSKTVSFSHLYRDLLHVEPPCYVWPPQVRMLTGPGPSRETEQPKPPMSNNDQTGVEIPVLAASLAQASFRVLTWKS